MSDQSSNVGEPPPDVGTPAPPGAAESPPRAAEPPAPEVRERLRALPSVDRLARMVARAELLARRAELLAGTNDDVDLVQRARTRLEPSLRRVLNATGVVIHTNLGRAPLAQPAREAVARAATGYANLELDLTSGMRSSRQDHVAGLLCELTGAEAALVVNNCAAATLLAAAALAGPGREVVVSRGQLIEIGGGFRIPEVIAQAGARLVEVGTTNRTRLDDYVERGGPRHRGDPARSPLEFPGGRVRLRGGDRAPLRARRAGDRRRRVGGAAEKLGALADEPAVRRSVRAGAAVVCFSADKLLGGPQAGVLVGRRQPVDMCARHPLARALRIDKLSLAALEATLQLYRDPEHARRAIPVLAMLETDQAVLRARAQRLASAGGGVVVESTGRVGGGALPLCELSGPVAALDPGSGSADALAARLRAAEPSVLGRIQDERLLLDPRTLTDEEVEIAARVITAVLAGSEGRPAKRETQARDLSERG